ncbi:hypothetical protein DCAR_0831893 [Daucus carota subsp. sativus]|uniref:HTH myb-type domain-containing protein n=1 Tax=Daucus carota subsp. sativus TaxID=79200 RepID=A0AAF0XQG6_DAUCS|nr:hypothetical protein DCAR_0831893 [Daucus carota subsp. sativus]
MVLKNRQEYGFRGYQIPAIPRGPRSLRRRAMFKKPADDGEICAFELLATVAGKLLQESESSTSSNAAELKEQIKIHNDGIKKEHLEGSVIRSECLDQGSCIESVQVPDFPVIDRNSKSTVQEVPHPESVYVHEHAAAVPSSEFLVKGKCSVKSEKHRSNDAPGSILSKSNGTLCEGKLYDSDLEKEPRRQTEVVKKQRGPLDMAKASPLKNPTEFYVNNTNMLINSENSVDLPLYRAQDLDAPFPGYRSGVKIVNRDDDENYFRSNVLNTKARAFRPQSRMGYRRMRKLQTSRYLKAYPKLKDYELSNISRGARAFYHKRKTVYAQERCQYDLQAKRRRLFGHRSDQEASSESISSFRDKALRGNKTTGVSSSGSGHKASVQSKDPRVNFRIKSFKVPELYIEVPETATIGSLKRTVMDAVTSILGGGIRVGVVLQGKKVKDDNRTLQQSGISQNEDLESLGFTLEPSFVEACSPSAQKGSPLLLPYDANQELSRTPAPILDSGFSKSIDQTPLTKLDNHVESNHETAPSVTDVSTDGTATDSKALVAIPPINAEALAMVPMSQKTKRSDLSQRRIRRPFSVSEVEALVEAVETLGTGRWRDVKMRAFDDANHRTYVDLKDKWKTLVHTASIAPQQRRGEPVPQELLDRVLAAHAYWSQHQSKHGKHPQMEPFKLAGEVGV